MNAADVPPPSQPTRTPHLLIFLTVFIDLVGFGIVIPALPLYAKELNASAFDNALLVAIYSLMQMVFSPLWGKLSDRIGRRPVLLISVAGTALGFFLMATGYLMGSLITLFLARALDGISGGNISTAQAYLADITPPEKRAKMMGIIGAAFGLGFIAGPLLAALLGWIHPVLPLFFAGALAVANCLFIYLKLPESLTPERRATAQEKATLRAVIERTPQLPRLMLAYFLTIVAFSVMTTVYSLSNMNQLQIGSQQAQVTNGFLLALVGVVGAVIQGRYIGKLSGVFGEKRLAITGAALLSLFLFLLQGKDALWSIMLVSVGIAVGNSLINPTLNSLASRAADPTMQGRTMGLMASAGSLGRVVGPLLTALPMLGYNSEANTGYPYWTAAAVMLASLVCVLCVHPPAPPPAAELPSADAPSTISA